ncbi:MAG: hypothetical protein WC374_13850 [Phycisphaerae bacterium]|jgi:DNA repair photolyase
MKKTGAYEWGGKMITIADGCEHNCRYGYCRAMAMQYRHFKKEDWPIMKIRQQEVDRDRPLYKNQPVFFQSASDITPSILDECLCVLRKLLDAGNHVLIVSKPNFECISLICDTLLEYQGQILFRFTIGSTDDAVLRFWESGAPNFMSRHASLMYAHQRGYKTSVSCEPYLSDPRTVYDKLIKEITDTLWVGKLNQFSRRVDLRDVTPEEHQRFVIPLVKSIQVPAVREIYERMKSLPKIRFKDSIREVVEGK